MASCNGDPTIPPSPATYRVTAILVKNLAADSAGLYVTLTKSNLTYKKATVSLGSTTLDTNAAGYFKRFGSAQIKFDSSYILSIVDGSTFDTTLTIHMPDSFTLTSPDVRFFSGMSETVSWSPSVSADGYILATQPPDTAAYDGYEEYVATNSGTITPDPFLDASNNRIVGTHLILVAAYIGAPVKCPAFFFDIPAQGNPADNVASEIIVGRTAGMVIAEPDTIIVAAP